MNAHELLSGDGIGRLSSEHRNSGRAAWPRRLFLLALLFLGSHAYFYEGGGWNQNTRFDLVRALVERHTTIIDAYRENTGDSAIVGEHYYADKAPGASLTAVPAVALVRGVLQAARMDVTTDRIVIALSYVATLAAAGVPATAGALCVFLIGRRFGASDEAAALGALVCGIGSPWWAYATILYGHTLAGGCLALALLAALGPRDPGRPDRPFLRGFAVALSAGWAVVTEYPAAVPAALLAALALWQCGAGDRPRLGRVALGLATGVVLTASVLLIYNQVAFGEAFHISYSSEGEGYALMQTGVFGVNWPKWSIAWEILLGPYRGLLPLAPALAVAPLGFWMLLRNPRARVPAAVAAAIALFYILLTSGYAYWSGGWSYGSRHLGPALPFLCLGIAPVWDRARAWARIALLILACAGIGESLVAVATTSQPPAAFDRPMSQLLWPAFESGDFPIGWQSVLELRPPQTPASELEQRGVPRASWNLGQLAGLGAFPSLVPLVALWLAAGWAWFRPRNARSGPRGG